MGRICINYTYRKQHDNPHNIAYTTFLHRIKILKKPDGSRRTREEAMRVPYFGRGGDRKAHRYTLIIKHLRFIDPDKIEVYGN